MPDKSWRGMRPGPGHGSVHFLCISRQHSDLRKLFHLLWRETYVDFFLLALFWNTSTFIQMRLFAGIQKCVTFNSYKQGRSYRPFPDIACCHGCHQFRTIGSIVSGKKRAPAGVLAWDVDLSLTVVPSFFSSSAVSCHEFFREDRDGGRDHCGVILASCANCEDEGEVERIRKRLQKCTLAELKALIRRVKLPPSVHLLKEEEGGSRWNAFGARAGWANKAFVSWRRFKDFVFLRLRLKWSCADDKGMASVGKCEHYKSIKKLSQQQQTSRILDPTGKKTNRKIHESMNKVMTKVQNKSLLLWLVDFESPSLKASMGFGIPLIDGMQ